MLKSKSIKNLNLNRNEISILLKNYVAEYLSIQQITSKVDGNSNSHYTFTSSTAPSVIYRVIIYSLKNGTTTIQFSPVNNTIEDIIQKIITECTTSNDKNDSVSFLDINIEQIDQLLSYLTEQNLANVNKDCYKDSLYRLINLEGNQKDSVTLKYFYKKKSLQLQGKPIVLFKKILYFIQDFLLVNPTITRLEGTSDSIAKKLLDDANTLCNCIPKDLFFNDYSVYVFPAFRALETALLELLSTVGYEINPIRGFGGISKYGARKLIDNDFYEELKQINLQLAIAFIDAYHIYSNHRNVLFHGGFSGTVKIITSKETAEILIRDISLCIEKIFMEVNVYEKI